MTEVKMVSILSTGSVKIHPEHAYGTRKPPLLWILTSRKWLPPSPINVYVIEHSDGLILFDTGQDRASVTDPNYFPGGFAGLVYNRLARFDIAPNETLTAQLSKLGYDIADVTKVVLSHLHQDHIGGLRELKHAEIIVSDAEWKDMKLPKPVLRGFLVEHIDIEGLHWRRIQFDPTEDSDLAPFTHSFDLMGDGSLMLLPTPAHTLGSLSMLVKRAGATPLLMVGDLSYDVDAMGSGKIPGAGERKDLRTMTDQVLDFRGRMPGLAILPAHDPGAATRLRDA